VGLVVIAIVLVVVIGICTHGGGSSSSHLNLTADSRGLHPTRVGETGAEEITVTNNDTDITDLVIFYANKDNWLDHHVATDLGGCTLDKGINAFRCGPLKAGESRTITITGTAKDSGNYSYGWGLGDSAPSGLRQWDQEFTWSEAVS